jgi:ubiquinone biosynthesis UbiH/UbiF/VisC/COQ6 family hydroxylase
VPHDLIVVGGGPVGASLARALPGLSVVLVAHEPRIPPARPRAGFDARVYALSPANIGFLGLDPDRLTAVHAMRVFGDGGARIEFDAYRAGVPALAYIVEDATLQDALWKGPLWQGLVAEAGRFESLSVTRDRARVYLDGGRFLEAKLVVAADGADSRVREEAGIAVAAKTYGQHAVVANFACERIHGGTAYQWFQGGAVLALLPLPGNHVSMVWSLADGEAGRIASLEPAALCREVELASGKLLGSFTLVTPPRSYRLQRLSAHRLIAPRVALVGDAAHVIHPLAGQGLNLGLQDVRTLSQVLNKREPVREPGDARLLRRYERQRAEPILATDTMVDTLFRLFGAQSGALARARNAGLNLTDRLPVVKNMLIRYAMA